MRAYSDGLPEGGGKEKKGVVCELLRNAFEKPGWCEVLGDGAGSEL